VDAKTIQQIKERLGGYLFTHDYFQFCALLKLQPRDTASQDVWRTAQEVHKHMSRISSDDLAVLVGVGGEAAPAAAQVSA